MAVYLSQTRGEDRGNGRRRCARARRGYAARAGAGPQKRAQEYARNFDGWDGEIVVSAEAMAAAAQRVAPQLKDDIRFAIERVRGFAEAQLKSLGEFEIELSPGLRAGQRLVPVATAGCYVPGGRYAHVASAVMSVTTARVAGVRNVIACSPARRGEGVHPAILYTLQQAGADTVLALGGVAGHRGAGLRIVHRPCGGHPGRTGQPICGGTTRLAVRARRDRSVRGTDRDPGDRR